MKTALFDPKTPGFFSLVVVGCLFLSLDARAQDRSPRESRVEARGPRAEPTRSRRLSAAVEEARRGSRATAGRPPSTAAEAGPFGGGGVTAGQTEKDGFTRVAMPAEAGRLEFVTRGGKTAVLVEGNWLTPEQASAPGGTARASGRRRFRPEIGHRTSRCPPHGQRTSSRGPPTSAARATR